MNIFAFTSQTPIEWFESITILVAVIAILVFVYKNR